jgi:hypothetical protein
MMQHNLKTTSMKNLIRYAIVIYAVFFASVAFSQRNVIQYPYIELKGADTVIVFKIEQGRKLAQQNEERKKFIELNFIQNKELIQKDSVITYQQNVIDTYKSIELAQQVIIDEKSKQITICDDEKVLITDELKKQKRYKWTAIISGLTVNIFTLWITQKL